MFNLQCCLVSFKEWPLVSLLVVVLVGSKCGLSVSYAMDIFENVNHVPSQSSVFKGRKTESFQSLVVRPVSDSR